MSYEEDDHEVINLSYKKLFKISVNLIEENDKINKRNLDLKDYLEFLEKSNEMLKFKIVNIRNSTRTRENCVLMKKEVTYLNETLSKFNKGKGNLDLILSIQSPSLNKTKLGFR